MTIILGALITITAYQGAKRLYQCFPHILLLPLLTCPIVLITALSIFHVSYDAYNSGGQILTFMLQPATVALAVPMYKYKKVLMTYQIEILTSVIGAAAVAIVTSIGLAQLTGLPPQEVASLAPRSITTPMAMSVSQMLGGNPAMTAAFVITTGVTGIVLTSVMLRFTSSPSPITTGLMFGIAAHGTGTSKAYELGHLEGAIASLAMIFMGIFTTLIAPELVPQCINLFQKMIN